eukprot:scaffold1671_cov344-Pavlova_lutheri.AAC.3
MDQRDLFIAFVRLQRWMSLPHARIVVGRVAPLLHCHKRPRVRARRPRFLGTHSGTPGRFQDEGKVQSGRRTRPSHVHTLKDRSRGGGDARVLLREAIRDEQKKRG